MIRFNVMEVRGYDWDVNHLPLLVNTLRGASSLGIELEPLLLPQARFDPNAVQVADWLHGARLSE